MLFYFRPPSEGEALVTLLRAATVTCLVLRWGVAPGTSRAAEVYGAPLQATLERIARDYEQQYLQRIPAAGHDERGQTERLLRELRALVRAQDQRLAAPRAADDSGFTPFVERIQPFLADLSGEQRFAERPLLAGESADGRPTDGASGLHARHADDGRRRPQGQSRR